MTDSITERLGKDREADIRHVITFPYQIRNLDYHIESERLMLLELDYLRNALDRIARPIWWLQEDAKRDGMHLNGGAAVSLANDPNYLSTIAKRALG